MEVIRFLERKLRVQSLLVQLRIAELHENRIRQHRRPGQFQNADYGRLRLRGSLPEGVLAGTRIPARAPAAPAARALRYSVQIVERSTITIRPTLGRPAVVAGGQRCPDADTGVAWAPQPPASARLSRSAQDTAGTA